MKSITVLPLLLSTVATAAPTDVQTPTGFVVSNFAATCNRAGTCSWSFNLVETPNTAVIQCRGTASAGSGNVFPATSHIKSCSDADVKFVFQHPVDSDFYRLVIDDVHNVGSTVTGSTLFPPSSFAVRSGAEVYTGDRQFGIDAV